MDSPRVNSLLLTSRFQLNPRTLPEIVVGRNEMVYSAGQTQEWRSYSPRLEQIHSIACKSKNVRLMSESGQTFPWPAGETPAELVFELTSPNGGDLLGFEAGARFLDLCDGLAPDKLTAEVRQTSFPPASSPIKRGPKASLSWSVRPEGPYTSLWEYAEKPRWVDGQPIEQQLRWPEVYRTVRNPHAGLQKVYLCYSFSGMGLDSPRWNVISPAPAGSSPIEITHQWNAGGRLMEYVERVEPSQLKHDYSFNVEKAANLHNHAIIFYCPPNGIK